MRSWLARRLFFPMQEALCGRRSMYRWQELEDTQWASTVELDELRLTKLIALLVHAGETVPYYRQHFNALGFEPSRIGSLEDIRDLPVLTKDAIRAHREDLMSEGYQGKLTESCTSGSTGSPLIFYIDNSRAQADVAARLRAHRWFNVKPGDPTVYLWGSRIEISKQDQFKAVRDWLINEKLFSAFEMSDEQLSTYCDYFLRVRPHCMYSYASTLWRFADYIATHRPGLKGIIQKVAFSTGEQMLPHWRERIINALECTVAEEYGCREGGLIAHECPEGAYHISAENVLLEILDDHDQPVQPGDEGRIVVTNLDAYAMPFLRYDTGDRTSYRIGQCTCGRTLPMIWRPSGRTFEFLETHDGTKISGVSLSRDLKEVDGVSHYRLIQEARDRVRVLVVTNERYHRSQAESMIVQFVRARIGLETLVIIDYVSALPAHASGKYRYVINAID